MPVEFVLIIKGCKIKLYVSVKHTEMAYLREQNGAHKHEYSENSISDKRGFSAVLCKSEFQLSLAQCIS